MNYRSKNTEMIAYERTDGKSQKRTRWSGCKWYHQFKTIIRITDFLSFIKKLLIYDNWKTNFRKKSYEKKADS